MRRSSCYRWRLHSLDAPEVTPADRILAVCAEMRAAEEYGLVGPFQYGAWRQAPEDVAAAIEKAPQNPPQTPPKTAQNSPSKEKGP